MDFKQAQELMKLQQQAQKIQEELRTEWETLRQSVVEIPPTHSSQNE